MYITQALPFDLSSLPSTIFLPFIFADLFLLILVYILILEGDEYLNRKGRRYTIT
jgi:hypothetical protein